MTDSRRSGDEPMYPVTAYYDETPVGQTKGMSKREHYAALFLAGLCSNATLVSSIKTNELLDCAVSLADRLVAKLAEADRGGDS